MSIWETVRLGEVCDTISATYRKGSKSVVLINTSDVLDGKVLNHKKEPNENLKGQFKKTFQRDDILYSEIRPQNRRFAFIDFEPTDYIASTKLMVLRCEQCILPKYLFQVLSSDEIIQNLQTLAETRSGTFPQITFSELSTLEIQLPPIAEQEWIAGILGALDDKIELNNRINRNLEEQAAALFRRWFVDFEFPDSDGNPYRSSGGSFIDSHFGGIPTGWKVGKLSDYASHISRGIAPKYADSGEEIILNQKCIRNHDVSFTESRLHTPKAINEKWLKFGDILINSTGQGTLGRVAQFFLNRNNVTVDSHVSIVRPVSSDYIYFLGQAIISREQEIESMASGSTGQTELPRERLNNLEIIIPDLVALTKFNSITSPYFTLKTQKRGENRILKDLRDTLLPKLMNNEIKI